MSILSQRSVLFATDSNPNSPESPAPPVPERRFRSQDWGDLELKFDDPQLTGGAGMANVFLHQRNLDLKGKLGRAIKLDRRSDAFRPSEASKFLIDTKMEGIERLDHLAEPRLDPIYHREYGLTELPCGKTMGQYLKSFEESHIASLDALNGRMTDWFVRRAFKRAEDQVERMEAEQWPPPGGGTWPEVVGRDQQGRFKVGLDYDSTCMAVYGKQEGADRGRHPRKKDKPGFQPKFAFLSGLDMMIHQRLYAESKGLGSGFRQFHEEATDRLPDNMVLASVRTGCALYSKENVRMFEKEGLTFGPGAQKTSHMWRAIGRLPEGCWHEFEERQSLVRLGEPEADTVCRPGPRASCPRRNRQLAASTARP